MALRAQPVFIVIKVPQVVGVDVGVADHAMLVVPGSGDDSLVWARDRPDRSALHAPFRDGAFQGVFSSEHEWLPYVVRVEDNINVKRLPIPAQPRKRLTHRGDS